jgi:hypothetical protein
MTTQQSIKQYRNMLSQEWQYGMVCVTNKIYWLKALVLEKKYIIQDFSAALGWRLWLFLCNC